MIDLSSIDTKYKRLINDRQALVHRIRKATSLYLKAYNNNSAMHQTNTVLNKYIHRIYSGDTLVKNITII
jgi:hypothetical protein